MKTSKRFVITGAAGFIGGRLLRALAAKGRVLGIDVTPLGVDGQRVLRTTADISDPLPDVDGFENATVIHAAAVMNPPDDGTCWNVNVNGTRNVLDWAARKKAEHVVFFSSGGVYGYGRQQYFKESDPLDPIGFYGYTKWIGENLTAMYAQLYDIPVTVIRLFWPYGPGQKAGVFSYICRAVGQGTSLAIKKDGSPKMNPVHVDDIVAAVAAIVAAGGQRRTYNLCGDETLSFLEAVRLFEDRLGKRAVVSFTDEDQGDLLGDNSLLKQTLGWQPTESLSGLADTLLKEKS